MTTSPTYAPGDKAGDIDWDRIAAKFEQVFGYPPSKNNTADKLLRDIRNRDPQWADAASQFIQTFGYAPGAHTAPKLMRDIEAAQVTYGNIGGAPATTPSGTVIPEGGRLIVVNNPKGSDSPRLYYYAVPWRGIEMVYEIGGVDRFVELFGSRAESTFQNINVWSQSNFDQQEQFVFAGSIDQKLGQEESEASLMEREIRAAGLEDLPEWIASNPDALALVATSTAQEWSSGRLWQELSKTAGFESRYGKVLDQYRQQGGVTIAEAVRQIEADEAGLRAALRPFMPDQGLGFGTADANTDFLQDLLSQGWTPGFVAQVLEQAEVLRRDPESLTLANQVLEASGLAPLDEVGFINALNGYGPQETVEAINTATAARALDRAGIDLADEDIGLIMELVDTSDRLLTAESWAGLAQELSLNLIRFSRELDQQKLGGVREDLIAAAFGGESPTGRSAGEVLSLVARFERDRRAAASGFEQTSAFQDAEGRLRIQGLGGL